MAAITEQFAPANKQVAASLSTSDSNHKKLPSRRRLIRSKPQPSPLRDRIIKKDAYEPIIDQRMFARARALFKLSADYRIPNEELVRSLRSS